MGGHDAPPPPPPPPGTGLLWSRILLLRILQSPLPTVIGILQYNILHPPTHSNTHIAIYMSISIGYSTGQCIAFPEPTPIHTPGICPFQIVHRYPYTPISVLPYKPDETKQIQSGGEFPSFLGNRIAPLEIFFWRHSPQQKAKQGGDDSQLSETIGNTEQYFSCHFVHRIVTVWY